MDPSPEAGRSDTSDDEMLGFGQGEDKGPYKEEEQEIEFEEGQLSQENIFHTAFTNQFRTAFTNQFSIMSPYLRQLDPRRQYRIDPLQDRPFSQQPTQVPRNTTTVDPLSRVTAPFFPSRQPAQLSGPSSSDGLSALFGAARAACTALSGMNLPPAATPQPTACTTVPVCPSTQGTTPVVRPATIKQGRNRVYRRAYSAHHNNLPLQEEESCAVEGRRKACHRQGCY
jgi:hypothetical protein